MYVCMYPARSAATGGPEKRKCTKSFDARALSLHEKNVELLYRIVCDHGYLGQVTRQPTIFHRNEQSALILEADIKRQSQTVPAVEKSLATRSVRIPYFLE